MIMYSGLVALDLARERAREADLQAARWRLAREAGHVGGTAQPPRPGGISVRALIARPVRAFSDATHVVSEAACTAASKIEGRPA
jgi:hypothetical protein